MNSVANLHPLDDIPAEPWVAELPKADLHCHAEAGPRLQRILAPSKGEAPYDWRAWASEVMSRVPQGVPRLADMSKELISPGEDALPRNFVARVVDALEDAARSGAVYAEIRFGRGTILMPNFMELFREAERTVQNGHPGFFAEPLATVLLEYDSADIDLRVEACIQAASEGLAGVDLIPDPYDQENDWTAAYEWCEKFAAAGLGITIHAGEFSTENLEAALGAPGVRRLGHAVFAASDPELLHMVVKSGVAVELCPTSNVVLGTVDDYAEHPTLEFVNAGVPVTINTDNPVRIGTDINREYGVAARLGLGRDELLAVTRTAVEHSFTSDRRRNELEARLPG